MDLVVGKGPETSRILTSGTGSRLRYSISDSAENATAVLLTELDQADPRLRLTIAKRMAVRGEDATDDAARILAESIDGFTDDPGLAWETATVLNTLPGGSEAAAAAQAGIIETAQPIRILGGIQDRQARMAALEAIRQGHQEEWTTIWGSGSSARRPPRSSTASPRPSTGQAPRPPSTRRSRRSFATMSNTPPNSSGRVSA